MTDASVFDGKNKRQVRRPLLERLGKEWLFFDGGTGTILQGKGLKGGELPERWNISRPEDIIDLHCGYLRAGCDIFNTNRSFRVPGPAGKRTAKKEKKEKTGNTESSGRSWRRQCAWQRKPAEGPAARTPT